MIRLQWHSNIKAQQIADAAYNKLKPKKKKRNKKQKFKPNWLRENGSVNYYLYIRSKEWHRKCDKLYKRRGRKCETCTSTYQLNVHHKTYVRLGKEWMSDLEILCNGCHLNKHEGQIDGVFDPLTTEYLRIIRE